MDPDEVAEIRANYPALREVAKETFSGNIFELGGPSALAVSEEERNAEYERRCRRAACRSWRPMPTS